MRSDRDRFLEALRTRLASAWDADGKVSGDVVTGPRADAELSGLLRASDATADLEARHAAGWLCVARAQACSGPAARVHGAMAGTLLFPVWVADPEAVPPELAGSYALADPASLPDPAHADGPPEWSAQCAAAVIAVRGGEHRPPPGASEEFLLLHRAAEQVRAVAPTREVMLSMAVGSGRLAVLSTSGNDPAYGTRISDLALALFLAAEHEPALGVDRDAALRLTLRALKRLPDGSADQLSLLSDLGGRFLDRYQWSHDPEDLYEAVGTAREVLDRLPAHSPLLPSCRNALGRALLALRLREGSTPEECDEVVALFREAAPGDPRGPAAAALDLAVGLTLRHQRTGRPEDLHEAVGVLTGASAAARDPQERAGLAVVLGNALRARFPLSGDPADLDAAVAHLSTAAALSAETSGPSPRAATRLLPEAMARHARYLLDPEGNSADLTEALRLLRRAVRLLPAGHPERPVALDDLGTVLSTGHQRTGDAEELNEAVRFLRESVALTVPGHEMLGVRLLNLGTALGLRHRLTEDGEDLREARECRRRAAELPGAGTAHRATLLASTAIGLMTGQSRAADPGAELDEAVGLFREALALTPADSPRFTPRRLNLAMALLVRHGGKGRARDAREARRLADAVVAALPEDAPDLPGALVMAASARMAAPGFPVSPSLLDEAIALFGRAVGLTPPGHAKRALRLSNLARCVQGRGVRRGRRADLVEAAGLFRAAALEEQCPPFERLDSARSWGDVWAELGVWDRALEGYVTAVDLLHSVAPRHLVRDDQEFLLGRTVGLGAVAAAAAVRCGQPVLAVGLLEQARGVLLSHAFDADSDLSRLREADPALADRFEELRGALDSATGTFEEMSDEPTGADGPAARTRTAGARADRRQRLAAEWRELTARIRAEHPGLGLLRPVREWHERELFATAARGPVVLVNVSSYGSDALVVTGRSVEVVPLPELDPHTVSVRGQAFREALLTTDSPGVSLRRSRQAQQVVRETLAWLWRSATGPVLGRLSVPARSAGPWPRMWWVPAGALGTLPLHAAAPADGGPGALDHVVSSYAPTLRALHHSRQRVARPAGRSGALVVAVGGTPGLPPLSGVLGEAEHVARLLPAPTALTGASATRAAVLAALPRHAYAHFACHALGDLEQPSRSRLVLHDHAERPLTVRDIARLRLPSARLAYLSACDTLRTSPGLADEAVHMVSALQIAGFPHVVGALWHVDDTIGAAVARSVYEALGTAGGGLDAGRTAEALHTAVRGLRDTYPLTPGLWACQVHAGP
ncbi:CHAT domain-containing protein [Streptomyces nitrosporeus]|uniref:CHAT domain-containing protein n=1 Tax=Streptomyces nitrosporeus TaxID=28894 RepID=UPI0039A043C0